MNSFESFKTEMGQGIERELERFIVSLNLVEPLQQAIHYAIFPAGKRIRPLMALAVAADLAGVDGQKIAPIIALELLHASSLIHDDLPALDNDDFRRGKPSCHKKFGEATAILAGDLLIAAAFSLINDAKICAASRTQLSAILARAFIDVCHGQQRDLMHGEERGALELLHCLKTGALFRAAVQFGLIISDHDLAHLDDFGDLGEQMGIYFQIIDDLIDLTGHETEKGRPGGSDQRNARSTFGTEENAAMLKERKETLAHSIADRFQSLEAILKKELSLLRAIFAQICAVTSTKQ